MKVIDKYEVEYVIPENAIEEKSIKQIIANFEKPDRTIDLKTARIVDNTKPGKGYWLRK
jgi:hypothetical protein